MGTLTKAQIAQVSASIRNPAIGAKFESIASGGITVDELKEILLLVVDPKGDGERYISPDEAEALVKIVDSGALDTGVLDALAAAINSKHGIDALFGGTATVLDKADQRLSDLYSAIAVANTGNIKFRSPKAGHTYSPAQYQAIAEFVKKGKITISLVDERHLLDRTKGPAGVYSPGANNLVLMKDKSDNYFNVSLVIHEITHAIQDYYNVNSLVKYVEADAYIAQSVAMRSGAARFPAFAAAADHVINGTAKPSNKSWLTAYDDVVGLVEKDPSYSVRKDEPTKDYLEKTGTEAKAMKAAVKKLSGSVKSAKAKKP